MWVWVWVWLCGCGCVGVGVHEIHDSKLRFAPKHFCSLKVKSNRSHDRRILVSCLTCCALSSLIANSFHLWRAWLTISTVDLHCLLSVLFAMKRAIKISIANKNKIKPQKNKSAVADWLQMQQHHVGRVWVWAWVRVFCVYLCASFSKQENHVDLGMC